jgi:hypothetical protein
LLPSSDRCQVKSNMKLVQGDLWSTKDKAIFVTTNSTIRKDGLLVMGRGAAFEMTQRYRFIPKAFGQKIWSKYGNLSEYGLVSVMYAVEDTILGGFQVKKYFRDKATTKSITLSTEKLCVFAAWYSEGISMNFPGIGYGGLTKEQVLPIVSVLPDNVTIYYTQEIPRCRTLARLRN